MTDGKRGRQHFLVGVVGAGPRTHAFYSYGEALVKASELADQHRKHTVIEQYAATGRTQAVYTVAPEGEV